MSQSEGLVSIVVPAYQADPFLAETLDRVAQQTYERWELIVVEDGSTGRIESIVEEFAERNPSHRVIYRRHDKNQGPSASRNTALSEAKGEFVALLDADDLWLVDHLQVSVEELKNQTSDLTYSTPVLFDDHTGYLVGIWGPNEDERENLPSGIFRRNFVTPSTVVMRREVFDRVGLFDTDPALQGCEDLDFWLRCVSARVRFACLRGCHCMYRKGHAQAATTYMSRITIRHAYVLDKHLGMAEVPLHEQHCHLSRVYRDAGVRNLGKDPLKAASLFYKAWRAYPRRIDALMRAITSFIIGLIHYTHRRTAGDRNTHSENAPVK